MSLAVVTADGPARIRAGLAQRTAAGGAFFAAESERLARLCHQMAERFARGGRLVALATAPPACSDARHVAVEFAHPVIVGKRALPAFALTGAADELTVQTRALIATDDIVIAFGDEPVAAIRAARRAGALTVAFGPGPAQWIFRAPSTDPYVAQELIETLYHVLWELVHVFFEHRGLLGGREQRTRHDSGASAFLYPFLAEAEHDLEAVVADVAASVRMKADEVAALRAQTLTDGADELMGAARDLRERLNAGGMVLALGNGGSATDAMDLVADLRAASSPGAPRPALDLAGDPAIITAIANDIGPEAIFARQVIAYGRPADALVAISTSGGSANVLAALSEARRRGLLTVALVGYDGGRIAAEALADHVLVTRSEHIPRIQEAQASAYHTLLAELA